VSNAFAAFMAGPTGRLLRTVAGVVLIAWGWTMRPDTSGVVLMVIGLAPLMAGVLNICLIAPLIGAPLSGRAALEQRAR
jgi:hypothetical protein